MIRSFPLVDVTGLRADSGVVLLREARERERAPAETTVSSSAAGVNMFICADSPDAKSRSRSSVATSARLEKQAGGTNSTIAKATGRRKVHATIFAFNLQTHLCRQAARKPGAATRENCAGHGPRRLSEPAYLEYSFTLAKQREVRAASHARVGVRAGLAVSARESCPLLCCEDATSPCKSAQKPSAASSIGPRGRPTLRSCCAGSTKPRRRSCSWVLRISCAALQRSPTSPTAFPIAFPARRRVAAGRRAGERAPVRKGRARAARGSDAARSDQAFGQCRVRTDGARQNHCRAPEQAITKGFTRRKSGMSPRMLGILGCH